MYDDGSSIGFDTREYADKWVARCYHPEWITGIVDKSASVPPVDTNLDVPEARFYIIWCEGSDKPPTTKFHYRQVVKVIANMRAKHPDSIFHIMAKVEE